MKLKNIPLALLPALLLISCTTGGVRMVPDDQYRLSSFSLFDGSENLIRQVDITYNEIDKPAEVVTRDSSGEISGRKIMTYTETGKISSQQNDLSEVSFIKAEYFYDKDDYLISVLTSNENENILGTNKYINDERGNSVEWLAEYSNGSEKTHFLMDYDDSDRVIKTTELDRNDNMIYYSISEYNESGSELSYTIYSPEGLIDQQQLSYYRCEQLIKTEVRGESEEVLFYTDYILDESDLPREILSYNQYGDLTGRVEIAYSESGLETSRITYDYEGKLIEKIMKEYNEAGNLAAVFLYDGNESIITVTRNSYAKAPLNMSESEFNALVFRL